MRIREQVSFYFSVHSINSSFFIIYFIQVFSGIKKYKRNPPTTHLLANKGVKISIKTAYFTC